jgi:trehalose 6-phosphate synthase/phosphatase
MKVTRSKRLFIVANRLPVTITTHKEEAEIAQSSGGLVTAINSYLQHAGNEFSDFFWVGVPGCNSATWKEVSHKIHQATFTYIPVHIADADYEKYYNGFSNSVIWPLFHYFPSYAEYSMDEYSHYIKVNQQFAEILYRNCSAGDTIWIHDYHLLPLAQMMRELVPEITIGIFLHIPFPSFEIFRLLPRKWQEGILKGMLGADLIGFHTIDYASHFLQSIQMVLGIDNDRNVIRNNDRLIKVDVFPISIDYALFNNSYNDEKVIALRNVLLDQEKERKIIFSVDRLDYTKGVQNRLRAYEYFLKENPQYHNKVVFIIVVVPSRDTIPKYVERKKLIDEMISRINSHIGNIHWQPVIYQYNTLEFHEMMALYTSCHLALITPLRDGMNLVSKEFIASRKDKKGVLIISEMAGAARELSEALMINPNDTMEMAEQIKAGLEMEEAEQYERLTSMQKRLENYDVQTWASDFMLGLNNIKQRQQTFQEIFLDEYSKRNLMDCYRSAHKRLLFLDYDGTLVSFNSSPENAVPGAELIDLLTRLATQPQNDLFIISGRSSTWLDKHFGSLPLNLIAEHGARCKWKNDFWITEVQTHSEWKERILTIMDRFVRRCPHTFIEEKEFSIVWHYRNAHSEQGKLRASELICELNEHIHNRHLQVMQGDKIIEVRNRGIDKGTAIKKVLSKDHYDFIFAVGDDKTDEDMFKMLVNKKNCFTIKVGPNASYAQYNVLKPQMVVSLLQGFSHLPVLPAIS